MIGWLSGFIVDKQQPGKIVLNVNGVGYDLETSLATFFQIKSFYFQFGRFLQIRDDILIFIQLERIWH